MREYKRIFNGNGVFLCGTEKLVDETEAVLSPFIQKLHDEGYDSSDIEMLINGAMRHYSAKWRIKRSFNQSVLESENGK